MGLFDNIGAALGKGGAFSGFVTGALARQLPAKLAAALAASPYGDAEGLLERFREAGFEPEVASWLGSGENLPITTEEVMEVIDPMTMTELAGALGVPPSMLPGLIAQYLPMAVDKMSPDGRLVPPA